MSRHPTKTPAERAEQDRFFASFNVQKIVPPTGTARTPSVAKLIHLLIEERARAIAIRHANGYPMLPAGWPKDEHRDQARREIEVEVLAPRRAGQR